jgi:hypothetical protein
MVPSSQDIFLKRIAFQRLVRTGLDNPGQPLRAKSKNGLIAQLFYREKGPFWG